ncbi:MAG TPA: hypothetical protein VFZ68_11135 [Acidimicrobiales bacterium]
MTWPDHLIQRALRPPDLELGIVAGSTPVVSFGDQVAAHVATLGINPSSREFLDASGGLLDGAQRRLATLRSLGVERYDQLTPDHGEEILDDCSSYFDRQPYSWFRPLDDLIDEALGVSYTDRSACHLDLVQWATQPLWGELPADIQDELLRQDVGFLRRQLHESHLRVVIVNGRSAMSWVERCRLVRWQPVATLEGPPRAQFSVGPATGTRFIGWSCNLQSQHGAPRHVSRLVELVAEHVGGRRVRTAKAASGASTDTTPATASRQPVDRSAPARSTGAKRSTDAERPTSPKRPEGTASPSPRASEENGMHDGPVPQGLHFSSKSELVAYLSTWLAASSHDTIGEIGTYGGSVWITVDSEVAPIGINRDTTHEAVEALVAAARRDVGYDWLVVANRNGRVNRVLFSEERTPGWYAYLRTPLDHEARLGASHRREQAAIVQFPHPGGEHVPDSRVMPWNRGTHRRKFLTSPGEYVDADGGRHRDDLVFWGEWEAQSRIVTRWDRQPGLPTVLHEPCWSPPDYQPDHQNTDPWVFGDAFLYSNCKQILPSRGTPTALQSLAPGSMILFGSAVGADFVIDTLFVVAEVIGRYQPVTAGAQLAVSGAFEACTLRPLAAYDPTIASATFTLYRGAGVDTPHEDMFSFVPCRPRRDRDLRFRRPPVRLPGVVNPRSKQAPAGAKQQRPIGDVVDAWREVVRQVRDSGLLLGTRFDTPTQQPT